MSEADMQRIADDVEPAAAGRSFAERLVGAFRLDGSVYEEVASDPGALAQAAAVVACVAVARAIGIASSTTPMQAAIASVSAFGFWPACSGTRASSRACCVRSASRCRR